MCEDMLTSIKYISGMINGHGDDIYLYTDVKINFSSNIYAGFCHDGLFAHLRDSMSLITRYPDPSPRSLEERLAETLGVKAEELMVTNGATEAIYLIARAYRDFQAVVAQPTFAEYADACRANHASERSLRWICNPNNPTGSVMTKEELEAQMTSHPNDIFVLDASYASYTEKVVMSAVEAVALGNVLMLGSMTKDYGVPGLRLGYVVGPSVLLEAVRKECMPWSVNALAIEAGHYLLNHRQDYRIPLRMLLAERQRMERELQALGVATTPSDSHMLLCRLPKGTAHELKEYLAREHGILIRDASNFATLTPQHFRLAMQTEAQNNAFLNAFKQWI